MEPQSTERAPPPRHRRGTRIEPYLFVVLEGARLGAGGLRIALRGVESLRIGRGDARALLDADSATQTSRSQIHRLMARYGISGKQPRITGRR